MKKVLIVVLGVVVIGCLIGFYFDKDSLSSIKDNKNVEESDDVSFLLMSCFLKSMVMLKKNLVKCH